MSHLLKSVEDGVMKIVAQRPDAMNALSREMMVACRKRWKRRRIARGRLRSGARRGTRLCAGGDVKSMAAGRDQEKPRDKVHDIRHRMQVSSFCTRWQADHCHGERCGRRRRSLDRARRRYALCRQERAHDHGVRQGRLLRRLRLGTTSCTSWWARPRRASSIHRRDPERRADR